MHKCKRAKTWLICLILIKYSIFPHTQTQWVRKLVDLTWQPLLYVSQPQAKLVGQTGERMMGLWIPRSDREMRALRVQRWERAPLDWFVSYWSNEMFPKHVSKSEGAEAKFTNHKHFLRTHWTHWEFDISYKSHSHVLFVWPFMSPNFCRAIYLRPFRSSYLPFRPLPAPDPICQRSLLPLSSLCCYADGAGPGGHQHQKTDGQVQNKPDMDQRQAMRHPTHHIWHMGCEQMGLCQKQKGQPPHSPITDGFRDWGFWSRPLLGENESSLTKVLNFSQVSSGLQSTFSLNHVFSPCEFQWQIWDFKVATLSCCYFRLNINL